jgi:hypothetical protein
MEDGRTGSVYTSVLVPDFDAPLSASSLVLNAAPSPRTGETGRLSDLMPVLPTSRRTFSAADSLMAFLRVHQPAGRVVPARAITSIRNARDEIVATDALDLDGTSTGPVWTADYEVVVPIDTLEPGDYLLTADVTAGERTLRREIRFRMDR